MKKLLASLLFLTAVFAEPNQNLILDPHLSPHVGAHDLIIAHDMLEKTKFGQLIHPSSSHSPFWDKLGRFSELFFVWDPINYSAMVAQHEVFGHGYRVRSLRDTGAEVIKYKIGVPPPYGPGGGYTRYRWYPSQTSVFQGLCISSGGVESTAILANRLRLQWLQKSRIQPQQSSLYLFSQHDITRYILHTHEKTVGDMNAYTHLLNKIYKGGNLTIKGLKKRAYINFLDPFTYYSLYAWGSYIACAAASPIPMIPIGSYKYLPSMRMGLTPFGPEYYLENFLIKDKMPIHIYLRGGVFAGHRYAGAGVEYPDLWKIGSMSLGFQADVWLQPAVDFKNMRFSCSELSEGHWEDLHFNHSRFGSSASLICQQKIWSKGALFLQIGGKTQGFVPGEDLSSSTIFRVGLTLW